MKTLKIMTLAAGLAFAGGAWAQSSGGTGGSAGSGSGGDSGGRGEIVPQTGGSNAPGTTGSTRTGPMSRADCEARWNREQQSGGAQLPSAGRDKFMADCTGGRM